MSSSETTPRITAATRHAFQMSTVRIVGKLEAITSSNTGRFEANGSFQGTLPDLERIEWKAGSCYELIGQVQNDLEIKVLAATDMGTNDAIIPIFNGLATVSHNFPEVFKN